MREVRFQFKGQVTCVSLGKELPCVLNDAAQGCDGVDLTSYPVIYVRGGRNQKRAEEVAATTGQVVVYKFEWRQGWGEGVILPENFDPRRVKFYRTEAQELRQIQSSIPDQAAALKEAILKAVPGIKVSADRLVSPGQTKACVSISPDQESGSVYWYVMVHSVEEAEEAVRERVALWKEWNTRALEVFARHGLPNPGKGGIQLHPGATGREREGDEIGVRLKEGLEEKDWVILQLQEGDWVEVGTRREL